MKVNILYAGIGEDIRAVGESAANAVTEKLNQAGDAVGASVGEAITNAFTGAAEAVWNGAKSFFGEQLSDLWSVIKDSFWSGGADVYFMIFSIAMIWLIMFGAKRPIEWLKWGWIGFWAIRLAVFCL